MRTGPIPGAPNFTYDELVRSDTALRHGLNNTPHDEDIWENLVRLAVKVLQPARNFFGEPIVVTSGYRGPAVNKYVRGALYSHHIYGHAADIRFQRRSKRKDSELFEWIYRNCPFTELIAEGIPTGWVHVALAPGRESEMAVKYMLDSEGKVRRANFDEIMSLYAKWGS